ncbi:MAG: MarR family transcriptional regulator [Afipia sp. 62-7]|nr:MAG: MarR family transcriptional regulator [Afipia sp. 62-7]
MKMAAKTATKKKSSIRRKSSGREVTPLGPDNALVRQFIWDVISINTHLEEIRAIWARVLDITCPQWLILMAVNDLDQGKGISVRDVSTKLHVDPSFVTTQTKHLEKNGFMRRVPSKEDARVVLMSLTDKAYKQLANLYSRQVVADNLVFSDFTDRTFHDLNVKLSTIKDRLASAALTIAAES